MITLRKERCCLRSSTARRQGPSVPRVTSGGQKTGCPNRGLHAWTAGESTSAAALAGGTAGFPAWVAFNHPEGNKGLSSNCGRLEFPPIDVSPPLQARFAGKCRSGLLWACLIA